MTAPSGRRLWTTAAMQLTDIEVVGKDNVHRVDDGHSAASFSRPQISYSAAKGPACQQEEGPTPGPAHGCRITEGSGVCASRKRVDC